mgnify:CR=1 FL=1
MRLTWMVTVVVGVAGFGFIGHGVGVAAPPGAVGSHPIHESPEEEAEENGEPQHVGQGRSPPAKARHHRRGPRSLRVEEARSHGPSSLTEGPASDIPPSRGATQGKMVARAFTDGLRLGTLSLVERACRVGVRPGAEL